MANPVVCVPMKLDAYVLNPTVCSPPPGSTVAPITQPNYTFLRLQESLLQPDVLPPVDLHSASNPASNSRITDLGTGLTRQNRIGVYLHWILPRFYRAGTASTASASDPSEQSRRSQQGFTPLPDTNADNRAPTFRTTPNRYLVVRRLHLDTVRPATAAVPEFAAFIIESDRLRNIQTLGRDEDLEVDVAPYIVGSMDTLENQAEIFIGLKSGAIGWEEKGTSFPRVPVSVLNSSNQLFADYVPHNGNVFSMLDRFEYKDSKGVTKTLTDATASYSVIGWHSDDRAQDDPFTIVLQPGATPPTHGSRFDGCNMAFDSTVSSLAGTKAWLDNSASTRVLCHGSMYEVAFSSTRKYENTPADTAAALLHNSSPITVGTTPVDALLSFVNAHVTGSQSKVLQDLERIQGLLLKQEEDLDSQYEAADMLSAHNFAPSSDSGSQWNFSGEDSDSKSQPDTARDKIKHDRLAELNAIQEALDQAARQLRQEQWGMWALWWNYLTTPHPDAAKKAEIGGVVAAQSGRIEALQKQIEAWGADIDERAKVLSTCRKGAARRFYSLRDPTLLVSGVENPWPSDFGEKLLVRLDTQLIPADNAPGGWKGWNEFVDDGKGVVKVLPNAAMRKAAEGLLVEFSQLRPRGSPDADAAAASGGIVPLYRATNKFPRRDTWEDKQPWFPLFLEWELEYFHVPFDSWAFDKVQVSDAPPRMRYGIRPGSKLDSADSQTVSGRVLILPQSTFSIQNNIAQLFANTSPTVLEKLQFAEESDRTKLLQAVSQLSFLSAPLSGFTEHLTTKLRGTHIKPTRRRPGEALDVIPTAQISSIGLNRAQILQMGAETATTPYGFHIDIEETKPSPFKPVAHGQFKFTKLNIIDKFGQAISAIDPAPALTPPPLYPVISEFYRPQLDDTAAPNTITKDPPGHCQYAQIPPNINQDARLNAHFLTRDTADPSSPWRPATEWETPMWGWLVVNYAEEGLQFFLPNGTFYREVRLGGVYSATQSPPWQPFDPPDTITESTQLDKFLKRLKDDEPYLRALVATINAAVASVPHPPNEYAEFMPAIIGRPLALVNMGFSFELATSPLTNQSQRSTKPPRKQLLDYEFRVKLGDSDRVYDGLIGYFAGAGNVAEDLGPPPGMECDFNKLYTYFPRPGATVTSAIGPGEYLPLKPYHLDSLAGADPAQLRRSHNRKLSVVAGIIDPFTAIHAYSGILPINPLTLPKWSVQTALKTMTAFFSVGPIMVTTRNIEERVEGVVKLAREKDYAEKVAVAGVVKVGTGMPVPAPNGNEWMWLQPLRSGGATTWSPLGLEEAGVKPGFQDGPYTAVEGYLQLRKAMG